MTVEAFVDTNVFVYAVSRDPGERHKREIAKEILGSVAIGLSGQVLQEFFVTVTRKVKQPWSIEEALSVIEAFEELDIVPIDARIVRHAAEISMRHQTSYWDAAVLAAAHRLAAPILYTEDLNHGQLYGSVRVINPFRSH